jgi:hypothetical protein
MKQAYKNRQQDFKRRILVRVSTTRADLLVEEERWLQMMRDNEIKGPRYYNLHRRTGHWHAQDEMTRLSVCEKISRTLTGTKYAPGRKTNSEATRGRKKGPMSEETKEKLRLANLGKKYSQEVNSKKGRLGREPSDETRRKMSEYARNRSSEHLAKIAENSRRLHAVGKIGKKGPYREWKKLISLDSHTAETDEDASFT